MKLSSIQFLRAVACLMVVVYHLGGLSIDYNRSMYFDNSLSVLKIGVDIFFVLSGVVMVITTTRSKSDPSLVKKYLISRFSRIYPPYWFLSLPLIVLWILFPIKINQSHGGVDLLATITLFPSKTIPIIPVAWTLTYELMFYVIFGLIVACSKVIKISNSLLLWSVAIGVGQLYLNVTLSDGLFANFLLSPFVIEFIAGCCIGLIYSRSVFVAPIYMIAGSVFLIGIYLVAFHVLRVPDAIQLLARVSLFAPPSIMLVYGVIGLEVRYSIEKFPRIALRIGDFSYSLYLSHILIIHLAYRLFASRMAISFSVGAAVLMMTFVVCLAFSHLYYELIERPLSKRVRGFLEEALNCN